MYKCNFSSLIARGDGRPWARKYDGLSGIELSDINSLQYLGLEKLFSYFLFVYTYNLVVQRSSGFYLMQLLDVVIPEHDNNKNDNKK